MTKVDVETKEKLRRIMNGYVKQRMRNNNMEGMTLYAVENALEKAYLMGINNNKQINNK